MRRLLAFSLALVATTLPGLAQKEIAITVERLPAMKPLGFWSVRELGRGVARTLERHEIRAMGFVINDKILDDSSGFIVLEDWLKAGHQLGSNTATYLDFNEVPLKDFLQDLADGQRYLKQVTRGFPGRPNYRFLRFPLLHEGETLKKRKDLLKRLDNANYRVVPVSVVTADYQFNWAYTSNQGDRDTLERLKGLYLAHIEEALEYAEQQSQAVFERPIRHILQLHLGIATANYLNDAIALLRERGYSFITVEEALEDPAYAETDTYVGPLSLSHTDRIAATRGLPFRRSLEPGRRAIERRLAKEPEE